VLEETSKDYVDGHTQYLVSDFDKTGQNQNQEGNESRKSNEKEYLVTTLQGDSTLYADSPPSYTPAQNTSARDAASSRNQNDVIMEVLKEWHPTQTPLLEAVPGGVTNATIVEWENVKKETGIKCKVLDAVLQASQINPPGKVERTRSRNGRFYNIYNTYIYGDSTLSTATLLPFLVIGSAAIGLLVVQPFLPIAYMTPGMPTYMDRVAWTAANRLTPGGIGFDENSASTTTEFIRVLLGGAQVVAGRLRPMTPI